jgi:hypothetical protein
MDRKKFFPIAISIALILAGIVGLIGFIKGITLQKTVQICSINASSSCENGSITGAVVGALQAGGIITGIVALFVLLIGVVILVNSMRSREL